jgi:cell wall-associated NlpC family hydrolase
VFANSGPINGPWIIADGTRNCLKDTFTQFILQPPLEPIENTGAASSPSTPAGVNGAAAAMAEKALAEQQKSHPYKYVYGGGRGPGVKLFGGAGEFDCSSFTIYCYKEAGLKDPAGMNYSPIGATESMINNCNKVASPQPGDLCFFGEVGHTIHVTIYVGNGEAISMGGEGDPRRGPATTTGPSAFLGYYRPKA